MSADAWHDLLDRALGSHVCSVCDRPIPVGEEHTGSDGEDRHPRCCDGSGPTCGVES